MRHAVGRARDPRHQFNYTVADDKPPRLDRYGRDEQQQLSIGIESAKRQWQTEDATRGTNHGIGPPPPLSANSATIRCINAAPTMHVK